MGNAEPSAAIRQILRSDAMRVALAVVELGSVRRAASALPSTTTPHLATGCSCALASPVLGVLCSRDSDCPQLSPWRGMIAAADFAVGVLLGTGAYSPRTGTR